MEKVKLSKREKDVMRLLLSQNFEALSDFDVPSVERLAQIGFVKAVYAEGHTLEAARLTTMGKEYLRSNPKLRNPTDWAKTGTIIGIITGIIMAAATVAALFIACSLR